MRLGNSLAVANDWRTKVHLASRRLYRLMDGSNGSRADFSFSV
jgi:hypothetical protein